MTSPQTPAIRSETPEDIDAITRVTKAAFADHPYSKHTEHFIINALRRSHNLTISLVAEIKGEIVGHVAFSPVTISIITENLHDWYILGPVSVLPRLQKRGIGKALITEGLFRLKKLDVKGCVLIGDPCYYRRFGFRNFPRLKARGVEPYNVLALQFTEDRPRGTIVQPESFSAVG